MLRRLLSALVMVVLVAPAIAMCAGRASAQVSARHDCCPKEEMTADVMAPSGASMTESCCRMSDDAGQRVPAPVSQNVAPTAPATTPMPAWFHTAPSTPAMHVHTAPQPAAHVPRHLLLSVLIV